MSFIITARCITQKCRFQLLPLKFYAINQKICRKNFFEVAVPSIQKRRLCDKKVIRVKTEDLELIYTGTLASKIKFVKLFSLSTSFISLAIQPYIIPKVIETGSAVAPIIVGLGFSIFSFATPLILHTFTKKYVIDIYYNERTKSYVASVFTIFAGKKKIEFTPSDVEQPGLGQMLTNCHIKGQALLIDIANFVDPHHYGIIMGYDKPMNFQLKAEINSEKVIHPKSFQHQSNRDQARERNSMKN